LSFLLLGSYSGHGLSLLILDCFISILAISRWDDIGAGRRRSLLYQT
jgi:hypothetical protein